MPNSVVRSLGDYCWPRFIQGRAKTLSGTRKRTYVHAAVATTAVVEQLPKYPQILLRSCYATHDNK